MKNFLISFILLLSISCKKNQETRPLNIEQTTYESDYNEVSENEIVWDGDYCADVEYYNPNTGTRSTYTLTIAVTNNELQQIDFPNGGYEDDCNGAKFDIDGYTEFTSNRGYEYSVQINDNDSNNCFSNVPMAVQCKGTTEDGDQCNNMTDNGSGYCWQHEDQE